jgi:hypothetical protein
VSRLQFRRAQISHDFHAFFVHFVFTFSPSAGETCGPPFPCLLPKTTLARLLLKHGERNRKIVRAEMLDLGNIAGEAWFMHTLDGFRP